MIIRRIPNRYSFQDSAFFWQKLISFARCPRQHHNYLIICIHSKEACPFKMSEIVFDINVLVCNIVILTIFKNVYPTSDLRFHTLLFSSNLFGKNLPDTHLCISKVKYVAIDRRKCAIFSYLFRRIVPHRSIWLRQIYSLNTYGVKSPKFIWAPCAQLYSLAKTPQPPPPHISADRRGRYWSAKINDIFFYSLVWIFLYCPFLWVYSKSCQNRPS